MARVAVFSGPALRRNLRAEAGGLSYEFFPPLGARGTRPDLNGFAGALVELGKGSGSVTATNLEYNRTIAAGTTLTGLGFNATYTGTTRAEIVKKAAEILK